MRRPMCIRQLYHTILSTHIYIHTINRTLVIFMTVHFVPESSSHFPFPPISPFMPIHLCLWYLFVGYLPLGMPGTLKSASLQEVISR
ncbi:hypothetical protein QBC41DRAFT_322151 [Cercophora samala]|uniref:Uncharacterized protein n=1 Tax=Cercophora samala TaxID=330535 RepID=A0AA39ZD80_9PEZI|nr:hypothetical protein QBC41DRAFT_322151 [Cercophora samala]